MRHIVMILLILSSERCFSQVDYNETLLLRLKQIKKLDFYDNKVVILNDSIEYHDLDFPYWKPSDIYYQDDIVKHKYCLYEALKDTKGASPDISHAVWRLVRGPHPYLFFRDTARSEDLKKLLSNEHPYIKTYAFGALSYRKYDKLFSVVVDNLKDTTEIVEFTSDVGNSVYPVELMIQYEAHGFSEKERRELAKLITTKYRHLNRCLELLNRK